MLIYSALIVTLLPAFHYVLQAVPGVPADSLSIGLAQAAFSATIAASLMLFPALRRYANTLQFFNLLTTLMTVVVLVVDSGDHFIYIASGLLVAVGAQQGFYRPFDLAATFICGFAFQAWYSHAHGIFLTPLNLATMATYGSAYVIAFIPGVLRMRIERREIESRLQAQRIKAELEEAQVGLVHMARHDALTSLPNRVALQSELTERLRVAERCAVFFLDLDRFKDINDTLGHSVGDDLLREVVGRLRALLPPQALLARWGGDEFVIIWDGSSHEDVESLALRLVRAIAEPFRVDEYELLITASIGIAVSPADGREPNVLIRNADTAMYHAKEHAGRNFAFFTQPMHAEASNRHYIQNALHGAIASGKLQLYYQPIVEACGGAIVAAEALIRWLEDDGTMRPPSEFISIAEDTGSIVAIGAWVLERACEQIARWQSAGRPLRVGVNVSARQLSHPDFMTTLGRAIARSGIDPDLLNVELTETAIMSHADSMLETLHEIKRMGVHITIDDFGTGYSSFSYLKRFPLDSLKLDGTFVAGIEHPADRAIAQSIVTIAHTLGLAVTAEGVETEAQLRVLRELGCDEAQGFYFYRPSPVGLFETAYENARSSRLGQLTAT